MVITKLTLHIKVTWGFTLVAEDAWNTFHYKKLHMRNLSWQFVSEMNIWWKDQLMCNVKFRNFKCTHRSAGGVGVNSLLVHGIGHHVCLQPSISCTATCCDDKLTSIFCLDLPLSTFHFPLLTWHATTTPPQKKKPPLTSIANICTWHCIYFDDFFWGYLF